MFASPAFAQTAGDAGAGSGLIGIVPFILMFVIFYFFLIRPQQRRMKEHRKMIENLRRGDQVVTSGGILGKVTRVLEEDEVEVQIAEGVKVRLVKSTISAVLAKAEPVKEA